MRIRVNHEQLAQSIAVLAQRGFDGTVSPERPATATLNGKTIQITRVVLETVK